MNAEEIALEFEQYLKEIEEQPWGNHEIYLSEAIVMLRQLRKERDLLFSAHSHEMVRADRLAVENEELKADNFTLAQTVSELTTIRGSSTLVPDDKLAEMQAEIEKLRSWVEMLVEVPFFDEIDHYRGIPVSILRKAEEK